MRKELKNAKLARALQTSFGAWKDKDHPELKKKGTEAFVRDLRASTRAHRAELARPY